MNLTIAKEQLLAGLASVQNVVGSRTTLPILSNVLLRADGTRLELTATDLDVTITCSVEATIKTAGATTLPVKKLFGIARELNASEIDLEVDDKNGTRVATERILKATTYAITSGVIYYGSIYRWSVTATAANGKTAKTDGAFQTLGPPPATLIVARDGSNIKTTGSGYPRNRTINITVQTSWQGSAAHSDIDNRGPNVLHPVTATSDGAGELSYSFPAQSALEVSSATHQPADPHIGATVKVAVQAVVVPAEPTGSTNIVHGQFTWV